MNTALPYYNKSQHYLHWQDHHQTEAHSLFPISSCHRFLAVDSPRSSPDLTRRQSCLDFSGPDPVSQPASERLLRHRWLPAATAAGRHFVHFHFRNPPKRGQPGQLRISGCCRLPHRLSDAKAALLVCVPQRRDPGGPPHQKWEISRFRRVLYVCTGSADAGPTESMQTEPLKSLRAANRPVVAASPVFAISVQCVSKCIILEGTALFGAERSVGL